MVETIMRIMHGFLISVILLIVILFLQGCVKREAIMEMDALLLAGKYSQAKNLFDQYQHKLSRQDYLFFTGVFKNLAHDYKSSIYFLNELLEKCGEELSDSLTIRILEYQMDNFQHAGLAQKSAETAEHLKTLKSDIRFCDEK